MASLAAKRQILCGKRRLADTEGGPTVTMQLRSRLDTSGLSSAGVWVRRQVPMPTLTDEALCLAEVVHTWNLRRLLAIEYVHGVYAEVSSPDSAPAWLYLLEVIGRKIRPTAVISNHPLSRVRLDDEVRIVALLDPHSMRVEGALVEAPGARRMLRARLTAELCK